ncbi:DUF4115 domain-containing protein [Aestuariicella sp. G3-2]|uniref:RodZ domain-containing protein n=1 Tax=Pseudomaricurvus albidus TaxID=2842452 RepID=UPI001C0E673C|nr:RodZ domain-containing protein [Aestuariicella albida]MBU3069812.1 DUF4115 domain-containing protein [Aestuariicella albida]
MTSSYDDMTVDEQSPGRELKALREAAGFSLSYVADQMRLSEAYISYLEKDEFQKLPTEPFVLGYYRAYARILNVSPDGFIQSYREHHRSHTDEAEAQQGQASRDYSSSAYRPLPKAEKGPSTKKSDNRLYGIIAVLLVATWVVVSLLSKTPDTPETTDSPEANASTAPLAVPDAVDTSSELDSSDDSVTDDADTGITPAVSDSVSYTGSSETTAAPDESLSSVTDAVEQESFAEEAVSEPTAAAVQSAVDSEPAKEEGAGTLDTLTFVFSDECWLEVTDARGDVVAANLYQSGATAMLEGVAPFEVMLGNVRAAQLQLNGEPVTLIPNGNRKTLRTTVGDQGPDQ